jgi:tetratricopeptide (TPR) repeat protein
MWTDGMRRRLGAACILLLATAVPGVCLAEEGQYRSRVLLTPEGEWANEAELSVEELERQMGSIEDAYARSSAGRHLARNYVARKEYDKAIDFYREALGAEGLSAVANREMLRELAQVYLLKRDYAAAAQALQQALALDLAPEIADYLLLARAQHHLGRYVDVVATLDGVQARGLTLDAEQARQATALYYHAGAYPQCEVLLRRLLELQPDEPQHWHMLASVYLRQGKKKQALDQLTLARQKRVTFSERDVLLLANLHGANNDPYGAAEILEQALASGEVSESGAHYRRLFELWLQAREQDKARQALQQAARLSDDPELAFYLAQLQMEQEDFKSMHQTMLAACAEPLADEHVGRANLLLGISQLKLGDTAGARRSLINATLVGGVNAQAGQWLSYMQATPATKEEARRIVGICVGENDKQIDVASSLAESPVASAHDAAAAPTAFEIKTVPAMRLFYLPYEAPLEQLPQTLQATAISLNVSLVKSGGSADGPLQLIFAGDLARPDSGVSVEVGVPARGAVTGRGKFQVRTTEPFRCASRPFEGVGPALRLALAELAESVLAANHQLTGEARIVILQRHNAGAPRVELQLGIK